MPTGKDNSRTEHRIGIVGLQVDFDAGQRSKFS
jgi:hypothetical protein